MSIDALLNESTIEADLLLLEDTLGEEADMLTEALDFEDEEDGSLLENLEIEEPTEENDINNLQFFNQDQLSGLSDSDLANYHPDNTDNLNDVGNGAGVDAPKYSVSSITRNLLSEAAGDGITGDGSAGSADYEDQTISGSVDLDGEDVTEMSDDLSDEEEDGDDTDLLSGLL